MSVISNIHTATVYEAKTSKAFEGQRLVKTIAKADSKGNYGPHLQQTMCTSIPILARSDIDWHLSSVQDICTEYLRTVQNSIVSDRIKNGVKEVTTEQLGVQAIIDYVNSDATGDKWDAARIASWFNENVAEYIGIALIEKGYDESQLDKSLKAYEKLISETFSTRAVIPRTKAVAIDKAFKLIDQSKADATLSRFQVRIDKVLDEQSLDELLGL